MSRASDLTEAVSVVAASVIEQFAERVGP
jgi:hypothetical protein